MYFGRCGKWKMESQLHLERDDGLKGTVFFAMSKGNFLKDVEFNCLSEENLKILRQAGQEKVDIC